MNVWDFASEHWFVAIILAMIIAHVIVAPFRYAWMAWNRYLRSKNIVARGWPPGHLDADGDWPPAPEKE
jgi:hypothetical protein